MKPSYVGPPTLKPSLNDLGHMFMPYNPIGRPNMQGRASPSRPRMMPIHQPLLQCSHLQPPSFQNANAHLGRSRRQDDNQQRGRTVSRSRDMGPVSSGSRVCKFFSNGYCNRGSGCGYSHIIPTTRCGMGTGNVVSRESASPTPTLPGSENLRGNVCLLARQQGGCRMLQRFLEQEDVEALKIIWEEAILNVGPLITDPFGHYLWLRLLDRITPEQRLQLLKSLNTDMVGISLNVHGTRVIQKLLEKVTGEEEISAAVAALSGEISTLSKDVYGMHVVLRCLYHQEIDNDFIMEAVAKRIVSVSMHKHGCCVVQWCLDYGTREQREGLIDEIARNALELVQDAYGNYVVQQIMDVSKWKSNEDAKARRKVMQALLGNIPKLAVQKFSSIVVEKCLQEADEDIRLAMVEELVDPMRLPRLLQDPFANYVIQKVLSVSRSDEFQRLIVRIRPHLDVLSHTPFGKRIQLQMFRKFPILSINNKCSLEYVGEEVDRCFNIPPRE